MERMLEIQSALDDLYRMSLNPMSSAATIELTRAMDNLRMQLRAEEDKMTREALGELHNLQGFATNPMVTMLLSAIINVLKNPTKNENSPLIRVLLKNNSPLNVLQAGPSASARTHRTPSTSTIDSSSRSSSDEDLSKISFSNDGDQSSSEESCRNDSSRRLDIWSDEVHWNNDANFVRIHLPIRRRFVKLEDVTCSVLHLELGHRVKVTYPGVEFSVLINHSTIKGVVEARVSTNTVTIRIAKTEQTLWPYITFITVNSTDVTFHLDHVNHFEVEKESSLMNLIHTKKLDISSASSLPDEQLLRLIQDRHLIDPRPILNSVRERNIHFVKDTGYKVICKCRCDTCLTRGLIRGTSQPTNEPKNIHICDVWWDNGLEFARIFIPQNSPDLTRDQVECFLTELELHSRLEVKFVGTNFTTFISHPLAQENPVHFELEPEFVVVSLRKREITRWSYVTKLTLDESERGVIGWTKNLWSSVARRSDGEMENVTFHYNPHYHVKGKIWCYRTASGTREIGGWTYNSSIEFAPHVIYGDAYTLHQVEN